MTLLKQVSKRFDNKGRPYTDYFLCWIYQGRLYWVRVEPSFFKDNKFFWASAIEVPLGESFQKYVSQSPLLLLYIELTIEYARYFLVNYPQV